MPADLVLLGRVVTGAAGVPPADAVAVRDGRIVAVGRERDVRALVGVATEVLSGPVIVPGFVDAHLHFFALARRATEIDVSEARDVHGVLARLAEAGHAVSPGGWLRAFGWDDFLLAEKRPPTRRELDEALPTHPLRLLHRTGHAALLNGAALRALGLEDDRAPWLERDAAGRATGLVPEPGERLHGRVPQASGAELDRLAAAASKRLLAAGVTAFHDVTPGESAEATLALRRMVEDGTVRQRVRVYGAPETFVRAERRQGEPQSCPRFRYRGVKIVVTDESDPDVVTREAAAADAAGAAVAIHAVEEGPLAIAVAALARLGGRAGRHRVEHASLCPPPLAEALAAAGATVVTHPDFLARFGDRYRAQVTPEQEEWLYPLRSFLSLGVPLALGSDGPIAPPRPLAAIAAAVNRRAPDGRPLGPSQAIPIAAALRLHTAGSAAAGGDDALGRLVAGAPGDAVLLAADPTAVDPDSIATIEVRATVVGGRVVYAA